MTTAAPATPQDDEIPEFLTITFRKPLMLGDISYTSMTLREPTADEWTQWEGKGGTEEEISAISVVSGLPAPVVRTMGVRDLQKASKYLARFFD